MNGREDNFIYFSRQPEGNKSFERPRGRREDSKLYLKATQ
jgi:hypothetical protein